MTLAFAGTIITLFVLLLIKIYQDRLMVSVNVVDVKQISRYEFIVNYVDNTPRGIVKAIRKYACPICDSNSNVKLGVAYINDNNKLGVSVVELVCTSNSWIMNKIKTSEGERLVVSKVFPHIVPLKTLVWVDTLKHS